MTDREAIMDKIAYTEQIIGSLHLLEGHLFFHDKSLDERERIIEGGEICKMKEKLEQVKDYRESTKEKAHN